MLFSLALTLWVVGTLGFFMVQPNQGKVLLLFGRYVGTVKDEGLRWANPLFQKKSVSLRVRNFETNKLKVNDVLAPTFGTQAIRYSLLLVAVVNVWSALHFALAARTLRVDLGAQVTAQAA